MDYAVDVFTDGHHSEYSSFEPLLSHGNIVVE